MFHHLSIGQKVTLCIALPTTGFLLYLLWKQTRDDDDLPKEVVTSRQTVIEIKVPKKLIGTIIGHQGCTIKEIQENSGARVNFNNRYVKKGNVEEEAEDRVVTIRGTAESAQSAEMMIRKIISDTPEAIKEDIHVPQACIGRIIGRNGDTIRQMMHGSKCKINVERNYGTSYDADRLNKITLEGTQDQVNHAKELIEEKVQEDVEYRSKANAALANRTKRGRQNKGNPSQLEFLWGKEQVDELELYERNHTVEWPTKVEDYLKVFVSAVDTAGHFWVQLITDTSSDLDMLIEKMTQLYDTPNSDHLVPHSFNVNDLIAATFEYDKSWYRARIVNILDDGKLDLYYVDFGDSGVISKNEARALRTDFLSLPFQAIECYLANMKPKEDSWTDEAGEFFEEITYTAKWKVIMAKTINYTEVEDRTIPCIELIDTNSPKDINIAQVLVDKGYADWMNKSSKTIQNGDGDNEKNCQDAIDNQKINVTENGDSVNDECAKISGYYDRIPIHQILDLGKAGV